MFMMLGYHPGFTQVLYRMGDSPTNCFTPVSYTHLVSKGMPSLSNTVVCSDWYMFCFGVEI